MFQFVKVTGESLSPSFREGDYVLVAKVAFLLERLKPGDVVVLKLPFYGTLIKRVDHIDPTNQEIHVIGDNEFSTDSRHFGLVKRANLVGKVIWHIPKK